MSNLELLDRAAGATTCNLLAIGGTQLAGAGFVGLVAGGPVMLPLAAGAAMLLAANYGCGDMPLGDAPSGSQVDGCAQISDGGYGTLETYWGGQWRVFAGGELYATECIEIMGVEVSGPQSQGFTPVVTYRYRGGTEPMRANVDWFNTEAEAAAVKFRITPTQGECVRTGDDKPPFPPEMYEPQPYTDEVTNCNFNITFQGMAQPVPDGPVKPVYLLQQAGQERAGGGVMGGCNWPDTIFMPGDSGGGDDGGNEGPVYIPVPDGPLPPNGPDGVPWWAAPLLAASTNAALTLIGQGLQRMFPPTLPEGSFTLMAPCDKDEQDQPLTQTWTYPVQSWTERSMAHEITMLEALQTHLNWKTPICGYEKPPLEGQWVTTRWESIEKMDHSGRRLRKLFRYRTKSTRDLGQLSAYWADFSWRAGDVCVRHTGAWWGDPQIWAESEEEGQRVIRHAAAEAGIDPDQTGRWATSSSRSPRYGMSGTMKVALFEGFPWVASRDGAAWPNVLAKISDP